MFSQLRNAVEQLAQQPIRVVSEATSSDHTAEPARAGSLDLNAAARSTSPLSSTELAESALSTLRKSLTAQRTSSSSSLPTTSTTSNNSNKTPSLAPPENTTSTGTGARPAVRKSNLEERLRRATYAIGDASSSAAASAKSTRTSSPSPMSANRRSMPNNNKTQEKTAYTTPLPASPQVSAVVSGDDVPRMSMDGKHSKSESKLKNELNSETPAKAKEEGADDGFDDPLHASSTPVSSRRTTVSGKAPKVKKTEDKPKEDTKDTASSAVEPHVPALTSTDESPSAATSKDSEAAPEETTPPSGEESEAALPGDKPTLMDEEKEEQGESQGQTQAEIKVEVEAEEKEKDESSSKGDQAVPDGAAVELDSIPAVNANDANIVTAEETEPNEVEAQAAEVGDESKEATEHEETPVDNTLDETKEDSPNELETAKEPELSSNEASKSQAEEETASPTKLEAATAEQPPVQVVSPPSEPPATPVSSSSNAAEVESLQARLKQVEQRFADVSTSFKRLQAEKLAADAVLRDVSPLDGIKDADALRDFFKEIQVKDKVFQDEIRRLNQKLELQEDRIEEMRDTHRLESHSRSDEVKKIRTQLEETEKLFEAAQRATSHAEDASSARQHDIDGLKTEVDKARNAAKEEEEKRVKAISLLKTVRQKLVKAEKEKDDAARELAAVRERERGEKEKEGAEKRDRQQEVDALSAAHEKAVVGLKAQFGKDLAGMRERYEQEMTALRGQSSLELASAKSAHTKELDAKLSQIKTLENSLNNVTRDKNSFFDQLQLRQAELESSQAHLESLQHQNTELQFQLREANDRIALLKEEASELLREQHNRAATRDPAASAEEIGRQVAAAEAKYEARLAEVRRNLAVLEKERYESEADWSRKLKEKVKELEEIKRVLGSATRSREADESVVAKLKADLQQAVEKVRVMDRQVAELPGLREQILELEKMAKDQEQESSVKIHVLEKQIEELRGREAQMKQSNKTLRDELRKVQSSAALLERQRNPGVGYWTTRVSNDSNGLASPVPRSPVPPSPVVPESTTSRSASPAPSSPAPSQKNDEEVNLEYLRNVILQFLEHKEMRPNLVKVLSIILHFTPQETRRLIARV